MVIMPFCFGTRWRAIFQGKLVRMILPLLLIFAVDIDTLAKNPGVAKVERVVAGEPFIVHVLDWHYVNKADLRQSGRARRG